MSDHLALQIEVQNN